MLEPVSALAFEMHSSKGVFALLLGSGISRSAKIPTGWEITLELVRKIAATKGEAPIQDPASWYKTQTGEDPDYSKLLDAVASTPSLRQQVIKPFIEPSAEEGQRGEKTPTAAHRAIASLMAKGYVRVVITTNFDRLLEQALVDLNVHANVLSSIDQIAGSMPLAHAGPTIVKVHGDYLDTRIRNTINELATYERELDELLSRIFDEYGLVVCGWSADWDVALKAAIDRAPSRRFPMYWAARGKPSTAAAALIARRQGKQIPISSADAFFEELEEKTRALEAISRPHPLSTELAVALAKEYIPEPRHEIRLHDLLAKERDKALSALGVEAFPLGYYSPEIFTGQVQRYEAALSTLLPLAYTAGSWSKGEQARFWQETIIEFVKLRGQLSGISLLVDLRLYAAVLILYAYLLGAVANNRHNEFGAMACFEYEFGHMGVWAAGDRLNAGLLSSDQGQNAFKVLPTLERSPYAVSERIAQLLRPISRLELRSQSTFDEAFAKVELALSFGYAERRATDPARFWVPGGLFCCQFDIATKILTEWRKEWKNSFDGGSVVVMAGLQAVARFDEMEAHFQKRWHFY